MTDLGDTTDPATLSTTTPSPTAPPTARHTRWLPISRTSAAIAFALGVVLGIGGVTVVVPARAAPPDLSPQRVAGAVVGGELRAVARGTDGFLYERPVPANGRTAGWQRVDSVKLGSSPAAAVDEAGRFYVSARATNGTVLLRWKQPGGGWTAWRNLGGAGYGAPAVESIQAQGMKHLDTTVEVSSLRADGVVQVRALKVGTLAPPLGGPAGWVVAKRERFTSAPNAGNANTEPAPDDPPVGPRVSYPIGRASDGHSTEPPPANVIASGVDQDGQNNWYRGVDAALWVNNTRIGTPSAARTPVMRIAGTPTIAGYVVPTFDLPLPTDVTVLVRTHDGQPWIYRTTRSNLAGGTWTALGGAVT